MDQSTAVISDPREYQDFHAVSSLQGWQLDRMRLGDPSTWPKAWTTVEVRDVGRLPLIELPAPRPLEMELGRALALRRTDRKQRHGAVPIQVLSDLLGWSLGMREEPGTRPGARRHYPSAGARFPVDCHLLALDVEAVPRVAAVYSPSHQSLLTYGSAVRDLDIEHMLGLAKDEQPRIVFILSASMKRITCKYGNRGYRYALIEAGHVMQNLYLTAAALGLPIAAIGGFSDLDARRMVDGLETDEIPLYCAVVP